MTYETKTAKDFEEEALQMVKETQGYAYRYVYVARKLADAYNKGYDQALIDALGYTGDSNV